MLKRQHWYFIYATYTDAADSSLGKIETTIGFDHKTINKRALQEIKNFVIKAVGDKYPEKIIEDFQLVSICYLGEMTSDEYNS